MFDLNKRIGQRNYFIDCLQAALFAMFAIISVSILIESASQKDGGLVALLWCGVVVSGLIFCFAFIWQLCLVKQRSNDISAKNWLVWFLVGFLLSWVILCFVGSEKESNKFGNTQN